MAQYDMLAQAANTEDASSAGTEAGVAPAAETANPPGAGSPPDAGGPPGKQASPKPNPASSAYFVRALKASAGGLHIDGISSEQAQARLSYIARKYRIAYSVAGVIIKTEVQVGPGKELDHQLLLADITIEIHPK